MKRTLLALLVLIPSGLVAQSGTRDLCWRGRPENRCEWTVLTELGVEYPFVSTRTTVDAGGGVPYVADAFEERLTIAGGLLQSVGQRSAIGGIATFGVGNMERISLEGRYRLFLDGSTSVNLSGGFLSTHVQPANPIARGGTMAAGFTWRDLVGVHGRFDLVQADGRNYSSIAVGSHLGQRASVAGGVALGIGWAILAAIYSGFE